MTETPFPFPRSIRSTETLVGTGVAAYGPFGFKIFDTEDVKVYAKPDGEEFFEETAVTVEKVEELPFDDFTIAFPEVIPSTTQFIVFSARLHERQIAVTKGGAISPVQLEKELSKQGTVLDELRRDINRALKPDFGQSSITIGNIPVGHFWKRDADGNMVDGGSAEDIANAQEYAAIAQAGAQTATEEADRAEQIANSIDNQVAFVGSFGKALAADGETDDVAALQAIEATAEEVIRLKNATYYIGTDYTPSKTLRFSSGTKFLIADGVTVDFSQAEPEIHGGRKQRFYFDGTGTGSVVGLDSSRAAWFAGDKRNTSDIALAELQKWAESVVEGGRLRYSIGHYTTDGSAYIVCSKGQQVEGISRGKSRLQFSGADTRGFDFQTVACPKVKNLGFYMADGFEVPAVGQIIQFSNGAREWEIESIRISGAYMAVHADGVTAGHGKMRAFQFEDVRTSGLFFRACNDNQASQGIITATSSWMSLSNVVGTFEWDEEITWSGGSAPHILPSGTGKYKAIFSTATPAPGTTITGSVSGATATVDSVTHPHADGGIRLLEQCEAHLFSDIDVVGGQYPLVTGATNYAIGSRPLACVFTACLLDSGKTAGGHIERAIGTKFVGCWFSNRPASNDIYITESDGTIFEACQWTNSWNRAMLCEGTAKNTQIIGGVVSDYNTGNTSGLPAFLFTANSTGTMSKTIIGVSHGYGGNPQVGVELMAGAAWEIDGVNASACPTPIVNNSGGSSKIFNCKGYKTYNAGSVQVATSGGGFGSVPHGLSEVPVWRSVWTDGDTINEFKVIGVDATNINVKLVNRTTDAGVDGTVTAVFEARAASAIAA